MILHYIGRDLKWDFKAWGLILMSLLYSFVALDYKSINSSDDKIFVVFGVFFGFMSSMYSVHNDLMAGGGKVFNLKYLYSVLSSKRKFVLASMITSGIFTLLYFGLILLGLYLQTTEVSYPYLNHIPTIVFLSMALRLTVFEFMFINSYNVSVKRDQAFWLKIIILVYKFIHSVMSLFVWGLVFLVFDSVKMPVSFNSIITISLYMIVKYNFVMKLWDDQSLAFIRPKRDLIYIGKLYLIPLAALILVNIYSVLSIK